MKRTIVMIFGALLTFGANASVINFEVRDFQTTNFNNSDYEQSWLDHTSTITSTSLSEFTGIYSGNNSLSHLSVDFDLGSVDSIGFQFGLDGGFGASLYFDGSVLSSDTTNLWWGYNWGNGDVLTANISSLSSGGSELDLYWAENCCNGYNAGRFTVDDGQTWQTLSVANLDAAAVPEPLVIALFGAGLVGLGLTRRRKSKK